MKSNNMIFWDQLRTPPRDAIKPITGGRLKGKSDISPQWRLEAMTSAFGPIGIGWTYEIKRLWLEPGSDDQIAAFCEIALKIKVDGEWSQPIPGIGGSMFIEKEKYGPHTSDESFKMATTDALSVAMKQLGVAADIYRGNLSGSKYSNEKQDEKRNQAPEKQKKSNKQMDLEIEVLRMLGKPFLSEEEKTRGIKWLEKGQSEVSLEKFLESLKAKEKAAAEAKNTKPPETVEKMWRCVVCNAQSKGGSDEATEGWKLLALQQTGPHMALCKGHAGETVDSLIQQADLANEQGKHGAADRYRVAADMIRTNEYKTEIKLETVPVQIEDITYNPNVHGYAAKR